MAGGSGTGSPVDGALVVGRVASVLADAGPSALASALRVLVDDLRLSGALLRDTGTAHRPGALRAVAGDVVHAVPVVRLLGADDTKPVVEHPIRSAGRQVAVLVAFGARPSHLPVLRAVADVLGVALAASARTPEETALRLLAVAEDERDALADALHDGPVQGLVAARYAVDAAARGADLVLAREAVQEALVGLRRTLWHLRPRGTDDLAAALHSLSDHLVDAGSSGLDVDVDPAAALPDPVARLAYRLVQALALPRGNEAEPLRVVVVHEPGRVLVDVEGGPPLPSDGRWALVARAAGAELWHSAGRVRLACAVGPPPQLRRPTAVPAPAAVPAPVSVPIAGFVENPGRLP